MDRDPEGEAAVRRIAKDAGWAVVYYLAFVALFPLIATIRGL